MNRNNENLHNEDENSNDNKSENSNVPENQPPTSKNELTAPEIKKVLTPEEITRLTTPSELLPEDKKLFAFFPPIYKKIGLVIIGLPLFLALTRILVKWPNSTGHSKEWALVTINILLLGVILRAASRSKVENFFRNRIRVNAFAKSAIFTLLMNCVPVDVLFGDTPTNNSLQVFMIEFIIAFYAIYWSQRYEWANKIMTFFGFRPKAIRKD